MAPDSENDFSVTFDILCYEWENIWSIHATQKPQTLFQKTLQSFKRVCYGLYHRS